MTAINKNTLRKNYTALCCAYAYANLYSSGIIKSSSFSFSENSNDIFRKFSFYFKTNTIKLIEKEQLRDSVSYLEIKYGVLKILFNQLGMSYDIRALVQAIIESHLQSLKLGELQGRSNSFVDIYYNGTSSINVSINHGFFNISPEYFETKTLEEHTKSIITVLTTVPEDVVRIIKFRNKIANILSPEGNFDITKIIDLSIFGHLAIFLQPKRIVFTSDVTKSALILGIVNRLFQMQTRTENQIDLVRYSYAYLHLLQGIFYAYNTGNHNATKLLEIDNLTEFSNFLDTIERENVG